MGYRVKSRFSLIPIFQSALSNQGNAGSYALDTWNPKSSNFAAVGILSNKGLYVVQLTGVKYRDQAEALRGAILMVPTSDRPALAPGEFHLLDLVGLTVIDPHKQSIVGTVIRHR